METLNEMKIAVGNALRERRDAIGKRQVDVEIDTPLTIKTVSLMENGKNNACLDTLDIYVKYLGGRLILGVEFPETNKVLEEGKDG